MSHTGLTDRALSSLNPKPLVRSNDDESAQLHFSEPHTAGYGSVDSNSPDEVALCDVESPHPRVPFGNHPLTHSLGRVELTASQMDAATFNLDASPPLSPRSRTVLVPHDRSGVQGFRDAKGTGLRDEFEAVPQHGSTSASSLTNRAGAATPRLVSPDTYLLHLDAKDRQHVERFDAAVSSLRRYGNLAVPALIASGGTALYSAFRHIGNGDVALGAWSGLIGLFCIGTGMGMKHSLSAVTRVYVVSQAAEQSTTVHGVAGHED